MYERTRYGTTLHFQKVVQGSDAYDATAGRQDKAKFLAAGALFLSFCLHIVFAGLARYAVRCAGGAAEIFTFVCNDPSAIARNVRGMRDRSVYAGARISALPCDESIRRLLGVFRPPIVISWRATKTTFASVVRFSTSVYDFLRSFTSHLSVHVVGQVTVIDFGHDASIALAGVTSLTADNLLFI